MEIPFVFVPTPANPVKQVTVEMKKVDKSKSLRGVEIVTDVEAICSKLVFRKVTSVAILSEMLTGCNVTYEE
mgnify:CR=1 FL=1